MTKEDVDLMGRVVKLLDDCRKLFAEDGGDDIWQMHLREAIRELRAFKARLSA